MNKSLHHKPQLTIAFWGWRCLVTLTNRPLMCLGSWSPYSQMQIVAETILLVGPAPRKHLYGR